MICSENRFPLFRIMLARTRERAAPEMIAQEAIMPHMVHPQREASMTAYLISLALAGLVAIAVWEGLA